MSTLKGTEASLSCVQCFLYVVPSSINVCFSYNVADTLDRPRTSFMREGLVWALMVGKAVCWGEGHRGSLGPLSFPLGFAGNLQLLWVGQGAEVYEKGTEERD